MESNQESFFSLTPETVLQAVESTGLLCTGRCMALNSFENRVYDVELEVEPDSSPKHISSKHRIVKFYRPGRWTAEQIGEEHEFLMDLLTAEIPVIAPLNFPDGSTIHKTPAGIFYSIFNKIGGRAPDELSDDQLIRVGRLLGRIHSIGASKKANTRVHLKPETYGEANLKFLLDGTWLPSNLKDRFVTLVNSICQLVRPWFSEHSVQRIHGDCHLGNLLWNQSGPFFLDFDDMVVGPPVQDIWLLVPGRDDTSIRQRETLLEGYEEMRHFDRRSIRLIEALRALRFIHYATWIAKRWNDPAFPHAFPHFGTQQYWLDEVNDLEEQYRLLSMI